MLLSLNDVLLLLLPPKAGASTTRSDTVVITKVRSTDRAAARATVEGGRGMVVEGDDALMLALLLPCIIIAIARECWG